MPTELETVAAKIDEARRPEDLFGQLPGSTEEQEDGLKKQFRFFCRVVHPDVNQNDPLAKTAFERLCEMKAIAEAAIKNGSYNQATLTTLETKRHRYEVFEPLAPSGVADAYRCLIDGVSPGVLTIAGRPTDNDLMQTEAKAIQLLREFDRPEARGYLSMLPNLMESFSYVEEGGAERQVNVFMVQPGYVSLAEIYQAYPAGRDPKDMAWIWRRLLDVLGYAHARGIIHGAVLPPNVLVGTGDLHEVVLTNWQTAIGKDLASLEHIASMELAYVQWYPPEVSAKQAATPGTDLLMSARTMIALIGGDPLSGWLPDSIPVRIAGFLKSCLLTPPRQRPQQAWQLRAEFTDMIDQLWGKREYRPFSMPR